MAAKRGQKGQEVGVSAQPHSWSLPRWPVGMFPNEVGAARHLIREHRMALIECGALSRVGRQLVVIGPNYVGWLMRQRDRVAGYACNANGTRQGSTNSPKAA